MGVTLNAIQFNHDSASISNDAINIRKNFSTPVLFPEWQQGVCVNPEDSLAAYAIKETQGQTITIKASFSITNIKAEQIEIRALDPKKDPPGGTGCAGAIAKFLFNLFNAIAGNVLGEVTARSVPVSASTGFLSFTLNDTHIGRGGVGIHTTEWRWQYRLPGGAWTDFQTTQHRIYVILEAPKAAWSMTPGSTSLPWTDALDFACNWAILSTTRDEAAGKITQAFYNLGPSRFIYDCPGGGNTHYTDFTTTFYCTQLIDRLRGGPGNGQYVNCTDCGTIVSSFSNLIGCDLWQSKMGWNQSFLLNPINAIGYSDWISCGWPSFSYHEVAWKDACTENDNIFDACLQVDGDADPQAAPHTPLLPINMLFGSCAAHQYRWRLSPDVAGGCPDCTPVPAERRRRTIA